MASYNKVILVGNLTRDPQLSYLPSQTPVVEFGLAVNRRWRGQDGQQRESTCFIDCRCYGKQAETLNQYMRKGNPILVEGRLDFDTWQGPDGQRRSKHRVFVERFQFLGGAPAGGPAPAAGGYAQQPAQQGGYRQPAQQPAAPQQPAPGPAEPAPPPSAYDEDFGDGEEIPF